MAQVETKLFRAENTELKTRHRENDRGATRANFTAALLLRELCAKFKVRLAPRQSAETGNRRHDLVRLFQRHHVAGFGNGDELRASDRLLEGVRISRNDQLVAVAPDKDRLRFHAIKP